MTKVKINNVEAELTDDQLQRLLKAAPREMVERIYKDSQKITDRVKTFDDALRIVQPSNNEILLLQYNGINKQMLSTQAHAKLSIIAKALNEGWEPDFSNSNQVKYYPWFKFTPGVGFSFDVCGRDVAHSLVGSRLCYKSSDLAEYAGKQFQDIYNDFLS